MNLTIPLTELDKIPHLDTGRLHGRSLPSLAFHTPEHGWELWLYLEGHKRRHAGPQRGNEGADAGTSAALPRRGWNLGGEEVKRTEKHRPEDLLMCA